VAITENYTYSQEAGAEMGYNVVTEKSRFHEQIFELVVERKLYTYNVTMLTEANNIITIQQLEQPSSDSTYAAFLSSRELVFTSSRPVKKHSIHVVSS